MWIRLANFHSFGNIESGEGEGVSKCVLLKYFVYDCKFTWNEILFRHNKNSVYISFQKLYFDLLIKLFLSLWKIRIHKRSLSNDFISG